MSNRAAANSAADGAVTGFWHAGVTVRDMAEALRFYRDGLGLEVVADYHNDPALARPVVQVPFATMHVVFLQVPGSEAVIELHEYGGLERHPASARPCDWGTGHFCLFVDDAEAICRRLREAGFATRGPVHTFPPESERAGAKAVYAISPDGYHVELFQHAAPPPQT